MLRLDRGHARLAAWLALAFLSILTVYWGQLSLLASGLDQLLTSTLGTVFPAYPFLFLLLLLTALRWKDFHRVLRAEKGLLTMPSIRLVGAALIVLPEVVWIEFLRLGGGQQQYLAMEVAASSLVLVAYGSVLLTSPGMWRIVLPYASLFAVGLVSPLILVNTLGAPLAVFSSYVAAAMTRALGLPVVWQGATFTFVPAVGEPVTSVVTPACSAVYSISIYLGLLGLMYLDMRSSFATIAKFAIVGVALIPFLDSLRIAIMILYGFEGGEAAFWGIHDWLGYALFLTFYVGVLLLYSRSVSGYPSQKTFAAPLP